eukprot:489963-Hanusia_phi.AAC.1
MRLDNTQPLGVHEPFWSTSTPHPEPYWYSSTQTVMDRHPSCTDPTDESGLERLLPHPPIAQPSPHPTPSSDCGPSGRRAPTVTPGTRGQAAVGQAARARAWPFQVLINHSLVPCGADGKLKETTEMDDPPKFQLLRPEVSIKPLSSPWARLNASAMAWHCVVVRPTAAMALGMVLACCVRVGGPRRRGLGMIPRVTVARRSDQPLARRPTSQAPEYGRVFCAGVPGGSGRAGPQP